MGSRAGVGARVGQGGEGTLCLKIVIRHIPLALHSAGWPRNHDNEF